MNYDNFNKDEDSNNRDKEEILLHNVSVSVVLKIYESSINNNTCSIVILHKKFDLNNWLKLIF